MLKFNISNLKFLIKINMIIIGLNKMKFNIEII
jgi:hypothetical protein